MSWSLNFLLIALRFQKYSVCYFFLLLFLYATTIQINCMKQRITFAEVIENEWFKKGYKPPSFEQVDVSLDDVDAIFNDPGVRVLH